MRVARGMSMAVAAGLLIIVTIMIIGALWMYSQRYAQVGDFVQAQATLVTSRYVGGKPVYVVDIAVTSKADTRLYVKNITIIYTKNDGTAGSETIDLGSSTETTTDFGYTVKVTPSGAVPVEPGGTAHITVTLTGTTTANPLVELSFQLTLTDDAGNTYTVQTNSVQTG